MSHSMPENGALIALGSGTAPAASPTAVRPAWATLAAWDDGVDWGYDGLEQAPTVGEQRTVTLRSPFAGKVGVPFWCHWMPLYAWENGYAERIEDLARGCLVQARITAVDRPAADTEELSAVVDILQCRHYLDFLNDPVTNTPPHTSENWLDFAKPALRFGPLYFSEFNVEGDIGVWAIWTENEQFKHMLVQGIWSRDGDFAFAGHRVQKIAR